MLYSCIYLCNRAVSTELGFTMDSAHVTRTKLVEYYVRDINASSPTTEEVLAVALAINSAPVLAWEVKLPPEDNVLSPAQYRRLPDHIRRLFTKRERELELAFDF